MHLPSLYHVKNFKSCTFNGKSMVNKCLLMSFNGKSMVNDVIPINIHLHLFTIKIHLFTFDYLPLLYHRFTAIYIDLHRFTPIYH